MSDNNQFIRKIFWVSIFAVAMAFVESAVVVYLRRIYYPEGFAFPLKPLTDNLIVIEVLREAATILILFSIAALAGKKIWERFAYFLFCFGIWDIFYYVWLRSLLNWPSSVFDHDILFLMPLPWIAPVIAPVSISMLIIIFGIFIIYSFQRGYDFRPALVSIIFALVGTGLIVYSFIHDTGASLHQQPPQPYLYEVLIIGELFYVITFVVSYLKTVRQKSGIC